MKRFPKDCSEKGCPYCHVFDLSVDDLVISCDILGKSCDACDGDFCFMLCPLDGKKEEPKEDETND